MNQKEKDVFSDVILRFSGEIGIKGDPTRQRWEKQTINQVSRRLKEPVDWEFGRGYVRLTSKRVKDIVPQLTKCFGLSSFSPAVSTPLTLEGMKESATTLVDWYLGKKGNIESFGIRIDKNLSDITRRKIKVEVGAHIEQTFNLEVNLDHPDLPVNLDLREKEGFLYSERYEGPGGFPYKVQEKVISLLSGGADSTLAMLLAAKRGCEIVPAFFAFGKEELKEQARTQAKNVVKTIFTNWLPYAEGRMYILPFTEVVNKIIERGVLKFAHLHLRRFMFETAEILANQEGAKAIVTGEVIGEKSSQTIQNLAVTSLGSQHPILRPLAGKDKDEIFNTLATFDSKLRDITNSSIEPCTLITCIPPSTHAELKKVQRSERRINVKKSDLKKIVEESTILSTAEL